MIHRSCAGRVSPSIAGAAARAVAHGGRGFTVDTTPLILKYTYTGDANLNGIVSGDDYSAIDFNILVRGSFGWYAGVFNYDGVVSGDDYSANDFSILAHDGPL
jgi:hypothetical protein